MPPNKWRDTVREPLDAGDMGFLLMAGCRGSTWYVEAGPGPLPIIRARERVCNQEGTETRVVRFTVLPPDPDYGGLGPLGK